MSQLNTRKDKVKFLTEFFKGKQSIQNLISDEFGILIVKEGKVLSHSTKKGHHELTEPQDQQDYLQKNGLKSSLNLIIVEIVPPLEED